MILPRTARQQDAVFSFVDKMTKYVHVIPTTSTVDAEGAARLYFDNVFTLHGLSESIVSDRDPRFTSAFFKEVFAILGLGVKRQMSTANHPQTGGQTERMNRVVEDILRAFVNHCQTNWDELLPLCQFAINNSFQTSTGESPFFLTSEQHPITPSTLVDCRTRADSVNIDNTPHNWLQHRKEALRLAKDALTAVQARQTFNIDKGKTEMHLEVDDLVLDSS